MKTSLTDRLKNLFGIVPEKPPVTDKDTTVFKKGQQGTQYETAFFSDYNFLPRRLYQDIDVSQVLESKNLTAAQILAILPDLDADVSMALWTILRLSNTDYHVKVTRGSNSEQIDKAGQKAVEDFLERVNPQYGGISNLINQLHQSAYLQGAISGEAILDDKTKQVIDVMALDPSTIHFKLDKEAKRVKPYQYQIQPREGTEHQIANYVEMNPLTFWYIPLDPAVGDPYGRSPANPAIADVFFNLRILFDMKKVIHNQGWPRIDVKIVTEALKNAAPDNIQQNEQKLNAFIASKLDGIKAAYEDLKPDDTFIHTDAVEIGMVNESRNNQAFDPSALLKAIERRIIRSLKMLPILMGSNEGTTETHGTVQYEVFVKGIEEFQKMTEDFMEGVLSLFLRMNGSQSVVEFEFEKVKSSDRLADAQAENLEIQNAVTKVAEGWISNEEASLQVTGSEPYLSEEEMAAKQALVTPANVPVDGNPPSSGQNSLRRHSRSASKSTLSSQKKDYAKIHEGFKSSIDSAFRKLEDAFPMEDMADSFMKANPKSPEFTLQNRIDTSSPLYKSALDIVGRFFSEGKSDQIMEGLSAEGADYLIKAFENYGQNVIIRLSHADDMYKDKKFSLRDPGLIKLVEERAGYFPVSVFETTKKDIARTVVQGYMDDKTVGQIATDLRGKFKEMRSVRSDLIANTELNWATSRGSVETMVKNKVDKKQWLTVGDDRVDEECRIAEAQGAIPVTAVFNNGVDAPPIHPRCRCAVVEALDEDWLPPAEPWTGGQDSTLLESEDKTLANGELSRPEHQKQIEEAINSKNYAKAQSIVDGLDDSDPYKASMQSIIDMLS